MFWSCHIHGTKCETAVCFTVYNSKSRLKSHHRLTLDIWPTWWVVSVSGHGNLCVLVCLCKVCFLLNINTLSLPLWFKHQDALSALISSPCSSKCWRWFAVTKVVHNKICFPSGFSTMSRPKTSFHRFIPYKHISFCAHNKSIFYKSMNRTTKAFSTKSMNPQPTVWIKQGWDSCVTYKQDCSA